MVSLIDLAPTVLNVVGVPRPVPFQGIALNNQPAGSGRSEIFMECWGWERLKAVRTSERLVIHDVAKETARIFDLVRDPGEQNPIATTSADDAAHHLMELLLAFTNRHDKDKMPPELGAEVRRKLKALGYIDD